MKMVTKKFIRTGWMLGLMLALAIAFIGCSALADTSAVSNAKEKLLIGLGDGDTADNVTTDITLLTEVDGGVIVSWKSSNTDIIDDDGKIGSKTGTVTMTATLTKGNVLDKKTFNLTVKGK